MHASLQSKKRGLSLEEKRDKVLEIFHDTKDVFQLKVQDCCSDEQRVLAHKSPLLGCKEAPLCRTLRSWLQRKV